MDTSRFLAGVSAIALGLVIGVVLARRERRRSITVTGASSLKPGDHITSDDLLIDGRVVRADSGECVTVENAVHAPESNVVDKEWCRTHAQSLASSIRIDKGYGVVLEAPATITIQGDVNAFKTYPVVTRSGNNARHGTYRAGSLTCDAVRTRGIRRTVTIQTGPDARGAEAQPLYAPRVRTADGTSRDLVVITTMGNVLHAYDLATMTYTWETKTYLARPILGTRAIDIHGINDTWGILSTPVLDLARGVGIACVWGSDDGSVKNARFSMVEFSLATGEPQRWCALQDVTYDPGHDLPVQRFDSMQRKQRCSLLLDQGIVYVAFGTIAETSRGARGWIVALDAKSFMVCGALTTTARGSGGGIWMAGQGLSTDAAGNIYCTTGNGDFDGVTDFGECFLKIGWQRLDSDPLGLPRLRVLDWWAAFSDDMRTGRPLQDVVPNRTSTAIAHAVEEAPPDPMQGMDGMPVRPDAVPSEDDEDDLPTNHRRYDLRERTPSGAIPMGAAADMDLGSGGAQPIDKHGIVLGAGKDGIAFLPRMANMGRTTPAQLRAGEQFAQLAGPPMFFTYWTDQLDPAAKNPRDLNFLPDGKTHHMHSTPVYHEGNRNGDVVFCWGENERLKAYRIVDVQLTKGDGLKDSGTWSKSLQWLADGAEWASPLCVQPPGGMPGGMMCLSTNGVAGDAILWACVPYGDGNMEVTQGRLLAYDANDFSGGTIKKIWDSQDWNLQFVYNKFCPPVVVADHAAVLVANYSGGVDVYQLADAVSAGKAKF